jgi:hypothetical protein
MLSVCHRFLQDILRESIPQVTGKTWRSQRILIMRAIGTSRTGQLSLSWVCWRVLSCVFLSLQAEELFESTTALLISEQHGHNLDGARFGDHPENDGRRVVMSPDTLDLGVADSHRPHLEQTCWEYHAHRYRGTGNGSKKIRRTPNSKASVMGTNPNQKLKPVGTCPPGSHSTAIHRWPTPKIKRMRPSRGLYGY